MDYCYLELFVYRNSQYFLFDLLSGTESASQRIAECEKLVDSCYPHVPFSEERLALFVMALIGMNVADECLHKAFERGKRRVMIRLQKQFVGAGENHLHPCRSVNITALLLGVKAQRPTVGVR